MIFSRTLLAILLTALLGACAESRSPTPPSQDGTGVEFFPDELQAEYEETLVAGTHASSGVRRGA